MNDSSQAKDGGVCSNRGMIPLDQIETQEEQVQVEVLPIFYLVVSGSFEIPFADYPRRPKNQVPEDKEEDILNCNLCSQVLGRAHS